MSEYDGKVEETNQTLIEKVEDLQDRKALGEISIRNEDSNVVVFFS